MIQKFILIVLIWLIAWTLYLQTEVADQKFLTQIARQQTSTISQELQDCKTHFIPKSVIYANNH